MSIHTLIKTRRKALHMSEQALADVVGVTRAAVQQWERPNGTAPKRSIRRAVAQALGVSVEDLAAAESGDPPALGVSHGMRHHPFETPETFTWESVLSIKELPAKFCLAVPDDALNPRTPRGTVLIFEVGAKPAPGDGVLIEDKHGGRHVRRYLPGLAGVWSAGSHNDAYPALESERDGLKILATAMGRMSGAV